MISLLNYGIYWDMQFDSFFDRTLEEAYSKFLWKSSNSENHLSKLQILDNTSFTTFLVVCRLVEEFIGNVRDFYAEFFFVVGIVTLWAISHDYKSKIVQKPIPLFSFRKSSSFPEKYLISQYKAISKLSRSFSKAYGYALLSYFILYILYYSMALDRIFIPLALGEKIYELEFVFTICLIYGLGAHYSHQVCVRKRKNKTFTLNSILNQFNYVYM